MRMTSTTLAVTRLLAVSLAAVCSAQDVERLEYRVNAEVVRQGSPFLDVRVTALNPTSKAIKVEIPDCAVNVLVYDKKDSTRKVLWSSWRQKYPGPPRATGRTCIGGVVEMNLQPGDSIRGGPLAYYAMIHDILGDTLPAGEYPAEVTVDVSGKRSLLDAGVLSINKLLNGQHERPFWPSRLDSSLAEVEFKLTSAIEDIAPEFLGVHVTATNRGSMAAYLEFGACTLTVFGYRSAERTGTPAWRSDRISPAWAKPSDGSCLAYLAVRHLLPGQSASPREFNSLISTPEILADSLPEGMYYLRAELEINERTIPITAGSVRIVRKQLPVPSSRTYFGISYSASVRRIASQQHGPDLLEFAIVVRNKTNVNKTVRGKGCVPVAGFNSSEMRDSWYLRPAWVYDWRARPCPLHFPELTIRPGEIRTLRGRTTAPLSRMHYAIWIGYIVDGQGDQREGQDFAISADELD